MSKLCISKDLADESSGNISNLIAPKRATRISTGSIKRRSAMDILGIKIKSEPQESVDIFKQDIHSKTDAHESQLIVDKKRDLPPLVTKEQHHSKQIRKVKKNRNVRAKVEILHGKDLKELKLNSSVKNIAIEADRRAQIVSADVEFSKNIFVSDESEKASKSSSPLKMSSSNIKCVEQDSSLDDDLSSLEVIQEVLFENEHKDIIPVFDNNSLDDSVGVKRKYNNCDRSKLNVPEGQSPLHKKRKGRLPTAKLAPKNCTSPKIKVESSEEEEKQIVCTDTNSISNDTSKSSGNRIIKSKRKRGRPPKVKNEPLDLPAIESNNSLTSTPMLYTPGTGECSVGGKHEEQLVSCNEKDNLTIKSEHHDDIDGTVVSVCYENSDSVSLEALLKEVDNADMSVNSDRDEGEAGATALDPADYEAAPPDPRRPAGIPKHASWKRMCKDFQCQLCKSRCFMTKAELDLHSSCHANSPEGKENYKCVECDYQASLWNRMLYHLITHPKFKEMLRGSQIVQNISGSFTCTICSKTFGRKCNMLTHYRKIHFKRERSCDICGKNLGKVDDKTCLRHIEKCKKIIHKCSECKYTTLVAENLQTHMKVHLGKGFVCEQCDAVFPTKPRYVAHMKIHDANRALIMCDACGKHFKTADALRKHKVRFHLDDPLHNCPDCNYSAKLEHDLKKHIKLVHQKLFQCDTCAFKTNRKDKFAEHQENHAPDRQFPCVFNKCFHRAQSNADLVTHLTDVHHVRSKHQCPLCFRFFKKRTHLLRHLVSHTDEKPYYCQQCGLQFVSHSSYYRHRRKTGHDAKREGVVSIPQNISIQYVDEMPGEDARVVVQKKPKPNELAAQQAVSLIDLESQRIMSARPEAEETIATATIVDAMNDSSKDREGSSVINVLPHTDSNMDLFTDQNNIVTVDVVEGQSQLSHMKIESVQDDNSEATQVVYVVKDSAGNMTAHTEDGTRIQVDQPQCTDQVQSESCELSIESVPVAGEETNIGGLDLGSISQLAASGRQIVVQDGDSVTYLEVDKSAMDGQLEDDEEYAIVVFSGEDGEVSVPDGTINMLQQSTQHHYEEVVEEC